MALDSAATLVVGAGNFLTNVTLASALPADLLNPNAGIVSPATAWENIGHTSLEDIFSMTSEGGEATTLGTLQNRSLRTTYSAKTTTFNITLQQFDVAALKLYYGSNATVGAGGEIQVPEIAEPTAAAFLAVFVDGDNVFAFYAPKAEILGVDDLSLSDTESLAGLPLGVKPLVHGSNTFAYAVTPLGTV